MDRDGCMDGMLIRMYWAFEFVGGEDTPEQRNAVALGFRPKQVSPDMVRRS